MIKAKIYGAGSAGMHLASAACKNGWLVDVVDKQAEALERFPHIYKLRYGEQTYGNEIKLFLTGREPVGGYDIVIIATPPIAHISMAEQVWEKDQPEVVLIEKPLCIPLHVSMARRLLGTNTYVGYTHLMTVENFDLSGEGFNLLVQFQESWGPVLKAHPWMNTPYDSYLGSWQAGGGATSEHSHGINLWQHVARQHGRGEVTQVKAKMQWADGKFGYDERATLELRTDEEFFGQVWQDTLSYPTIKRLTATTSTSSHSQHFGSCRFDLELAHVIGAPKNSPLGIDLGLRTAEVIAAAHNSDGEWVHV